MVLLKAEYIPSKWSVISIIRKFIQLYKKMSDLKNIFPGLFAVFSNIIHIYSRSF